LLAAKMGWTNSVEGERLARGRAKATRPDGSGGPPAMKTRRVVER
jgi:hypothetical protein